MPTDYHLLSCKTTEEAFVIILRIEYLNLRRLEAELLMANNVEAIHHMRVSLRKIRSLLSAFQSFLCTLNTDFFCDEMHYFASQFDKVRNLDVYIESYFSGKKLTDTQKTMYKLAKHYRKKAYEKVNVFIKGKRLKKLYKSFEYWIETKGWQKSLNKKQKKEFNKNITKFVLENITSPQIQLLKAGINVEKLDDNSLHKLRIRCKELRYLTEFFVELFDKDTILFVNRLKEIQDVLGVWHDRVILKKLHKKLLKGQKDEKLLHFANKLEIKEKKKNQLLKKDFKSLLEINKKIRIRLE